MMVLSVFYMYDFFKGGSSGCSLLRFSELKLKS